MAKPTKEPESIFCLLNAQDELVGYYRTFEKAFDQVERECLEEAVILEVIKATDVTAPEEPQWEFNEKRLNAMVSS